MDKLRLRFSKTGRAVYISHLDLMRTMQRVFTRANLPLKYSEGFNPHAQISIALPLSVGCESLCELMDFRLNGEFELLEIVDRLNSAMPEGILALEVYEAERKVKELKWLSVVGRFEYDAPLPEETLSLIRELYAREKIEIMKRTKRGEGLADIKPAINSIDFSEESETVKVTAVISAQEPTLNPELLAGALRQLLPEAAPSFAAFKRIEVLDAEMKPFR